MKVLVCIPCLLTGGTEIQTLALVKALVRAGHRVEVAVYFEWSEAMAAAYRSAGASVLLLSRDGSRPRGVRAVARHLWRGLRGAVREFGPDAAHVQYMAPGAMPVVMLRALGIRRIVATAHTAGDIYSPRGLKLIGWLNGNILRAWQCITLEAERSFFGTARNFDEVETLRPHGNHFTIHNALPDYIELRADPRTAKTSDAPLTVGVVSRLEPIKGMDLVVPAFAAWLARSGRDGRLLVVGDGSLRAHMQQQVAEAGITDRVEFAGRQPQGRLQGYYDRIDILLMPSRSEGFGLTAIEGMARGCTLVASRTGGLPEVVTPGSGLLVAPGDVSALADGIGLAAADLSPLSEGGRGRAADFSAGAYAARITRLYSIV